MAAPNGIVFWEGPSPIDGAPIVAIATGLKRPSTNVKTAGMVQTWILRADMLPTDAVNTGCDRAICGDCPMRKTEEHGRVCYLNIGQAPQQVYKAFRNGKYPRCSPEEAAEHFAGKQIRLGAYGDPGMVPLALWDRILVDSEDYSGFSHQWRSIDPGFARLCMASVETVEDARVARAAGWRTFRVAAKRVDGEKPCPAQMGRVLCAKCPIKCHGSDKPSIVIAPHGPGATNLAA